MKPGRVILAGAGPGDPDLITVKAARYLRLADVVIVDRLVSKDILLEYANPSAKIVFVGKQHGAKNSAAQSTINDMLVDAAFENSLVVRLKGGDVAFYSNVLEELQALRHHDIPYEIVPGITAASGASAYSGIPLTARGYADSVRFMTYCYGAERQPDWLYLIRSENTLVLYMSGHHIGDFSRRLISAGGNGQTPVALIENATTPLQRIHISNLESLAVQSPGLNGPVLIIVGAVVDLHERFSWFLSEKSKGNYFTDLNTIGEIKYKTELV